MSDFDLGAVHPLVRLSQGHEPAVGEEPARAAEPEREAAPPADLEPALHNIGRVVEPAPGEDDLERPYDLIRAGLEDPETRAAAAEIERRNAGVTD